jgi:hypothetical protein
MNTLQKDASAVLQDTTSSEAAVRIAIAILSILECLDSSNKEGSK